ncbi:MAG: T9SS type A sorting domain-containing protein [Flavobacteriales bacterium]|nr:T9SS type A sorting domain-containing protein [Flavobacteriales bacterium]
MNKLLPLIALFVINSNLSAQSLSGVESVEYDPINNRYLASSDGSSIVAIAPNGGLSYFGSGTAADYGMEVMNGTLFAITGTSIKGYDLNSETEVMSMTISGAQFLNGMGSNGTDKLWVSDFNGYSIYEIDVTNLSSPSYNMVADQTDIGTTNKPNGIVYDGDNNRILIVGWGSNAPIKAMDLTSYNVTDVVSNTGVGNIDGIDKDGDGNWFISSWSPARITKYNNDFSISEVITVPGISSPADICYAPETDTLAIPGGNQVLFVGFETSAVGIEEETFDAYTIHYNAGFPVVQFDLSNNQEVSMDVIDMSGRVVYTVLEGMQPKGAQTVVLSSIGLYSGNYICRMQSKELSFTERIIIP